MKSRCVNPRCRAFPDYGGRGITVCERWQEFAPFFCDTGETPKGASLDRIDNDKGYWCGKPECPECGSLGRAPNWRWATRVEQQRNTRAAFLITHKGETRPLGEWAELLGLSRQIIHQRLHRGDPSPLRPKRKPKKWQFSSRQQTYRIWHGMVARCHNRKNPGYRYYGARGTKVCPRWHQFEAFLKDMGARPSEAHTLDRINSAGNYQPSNCRWVTKSVQYTNRRKPRPRRKYTPRHVEC